MSKKTPDPKKTGKGRDTDAPREREAAQTAAEKDSLIDSRLAIPFDKNGVILLDNMRESSREKLKSVLSDAKLAKELGLGDTPAAAPAAMGLPPEFMFPLISGLSILETLIVARATNAPRDIVERIAPYTDAEAKVIAPPLAKVLGKYSGSFLEKYQDELALAMVLSATTMGKIAAVNAEMRQRGPRGVVIPMTDVTPAPPPASTAPPADPGVES